jgi:hypothetical protein
MTERWIDIERTPDASDIAFIKEVATLLKQPDEQRRAGLHELRRTLHAKHTAAKSSRQLERDIVRHVLLDLIGQGWRVRLRNGRAQLAHAADSVAPAEKEHVRRLHLNERDAQLRNPAIREFVTRMERRRLMKTGGWHSIFSLMRDGRELRDKLASSLASTTDEERHGVLAQCIKPYLQFIEGEETCVHTGLVLRDVWRYFRLTWVNVHKSLPGRTMMILVRDAAAPNHPVIGIASLGSAVVQQELRDRWIGWNPDLIVERLAAHPRVSDAKRLLGELSTLIKETYTKDLIKERKIRSGEIRKPTNRVITRLRIEAERAMKQHHRFPRAAEHKSLTTAGKWEALARMMLYRAKRCDHLAGLLSVRKIFTEQGFTARSEKKLRKALESAAVRTAVGQLARRIKAVHVGIDMMDITVCGAIAPYNHILGGKLVCMLLTSPELVQAYARRYRDQPSVIASSMKGRAVKRIPQLVLLCTTSLYGVGSSQYNRIKIPAETVGGKPGAHIEYVELGKSRGYGSFHFSKATLDHIKILLSRRIEGRRVNSIFGEGVNPLMRKIREALEGLGLPSDEILRHGMSRVVYGVPLAKNFGDVLAGLASRPQYIIPQTHAAARTDAIAAFWRRRWLDRRIRRPEILESVGTHSLALPVRHGAQVPLPDDGEVVELRLWNQ